MGGTDRYEPARTPVCPLRVLRPPPGPASVVLPLVGVIGDELTASLCEVVRGLLDDHGAGIDVITCDARAAVGGVGLVGALARLQLTARRLGYAIRIRAAGEELRILVELTGLAGTLPLVSAQDEGQPE